MGRVLITGIGGFVGRHLAAALLSRGDEVHGTLRSPDPRQIDDLTGRFPPLTNRLHVADVIDAGAVDGVITAVQPQAVFHLAGMTFVPDTLAHPAAAMQVNVLGAVHVFAAVKRSAPGCRVVAVGSGDAYGEVRPEELPVRESCPFRPLSPYAVSKAALDMVAYQWSRTEGVDVVRVRDVAAAYVAVCDRGNSGEAYNVCSGVGRSIRSMLDELSGIVGVEVRTETAAQRLRPVSVPVLIGNADKLRDATGWAPRYEWHQTLTDVVADWT